MKTAVLFATLALSIMGCRAAALGPDTGNAVQEALAAQRASTEEGKARGISAEDAKLVLHVHRNGPNASNAGPSLGGASSSGYGGSPLMSTPNSVTGSGAGAAGGSSDGIYLRAK